MASLGTGTAHVRCPACDTDIPITYTSPDSRTLTFDTQQVHQHVAAHNDEPVDRCCGCSGEQCCQHGEAECST